MTASNCKKEKRKEKKYERKKEKGEKYIYQTALKYNGWGKLENIA